MEVKKKNRKLKNMNNMLHKVYINYFYFIFENYIQRKFKSNTIHIK